MLCNKSIKFQLPLGLPIVNVGGFKRSQKVGVPVLHQLPQGALLQEYFMYMI